MKDNAGHLVSNGLIQHTTDIHTDEATPGNIMQSTDAPATPRSLEQLQFEAKGMLHHLVQTVVAAFTPVGN